MVGDFNEFCAVVPNPVERLHLKQFVKTYSTFIESTITSAMCTKCKVRTSRDLFSSPRAQLSSELKLTQCYFVFMSSELL